ncbi:MAG: PQQ-dependent sugar dehydrogenase [Bacteroidota bacterium]
MTKMIFTLCWLAFATSIFGQTEDEKLQIPLQDYMIGTSYNYPDQIVRAFSDSAILYLTKDGAPWVVSPKTYADLFAKRKAGQFNGRIAKLINTEIYQDIATAEIEIKIPKINARFIDLLLLQKYDGNWKIISKMATRYPMQSEGTFPKRKVVVEGLRRPWSMDFISAKEAVIAEKDGDLLLVDLATKERMAIQGFPDDLYTLKKIHLKDYPAYTFPKNADGKALSYNAGILEVLLDPNFEENQWIYVSYVAEKGDQYALKVVRASLQENQLNNVETLLMPGPYKEGLFHFGGGMTFGTDGKLYITVGERLFYEHSKEGLAIAQDVTDARGKIYRLNPDGSIPADNPDFGKDAIQGLYAIGIRAAQGITVEPHTGQIWFSEHGTIQGDEINLLEAGANYGWPNVTSGKYRSKGYQAGEVPNANFSDPIHYWLQTVAPTGLTFYTGNAFPDWQGNLIVPGLSRGSLWRLVLKGKSVQTVEELFVDDHVRLRKAKMSPDGRLYLLTDEEKGRIFEVIK